jgi:hypothetical protein
MTLFDAYAQCTARDRIARAGRENDWNIVPAQTFIETCARIANIFGPEETLHTDWIVVQGTGGTS